MGVSAKAIRLPDATRWPPYGLAHVRRLTDATGMVEHAVGGVPNPTEGYTLDDNARALVTVLRYHHIARDAESLELAFRYLSFIVYCQLPDGWFHNDVGYDRRFLDERAPEDPVGRALWALAEAAAIAELEALRVAAVRTLARSLAWAERFEGLRPAAYTLIGLGHALQAPPDRLPRELADRAAALVQRLAQRLVSAFAQTSSGSWQWFEPRLTYCNACLPHALVAAWQATGRVEFLEVAGVTADFLWRHLWDGRVWHVVGNRGWWERGRPPARFDQQPVDAGATAELSAALFAATGDPRHLERACAALEWFYGRNAAGTPMVDATTGGCRDGLGADGVNPNQGAESTLAHLMARMAVERALEQAGSGSRLAMA